MRLDAAPPWTHAGPIFHQPRMHRAAESYVLSKNTFIAGAQCHRRLWWHLHEAAAPELRDDAVLRHRLEEGARVGAVARSHVATSGVLIQRGGRSMEAILTDTRTAIADPSVRVIYEAAAIAHDTIIFADILERVPGGFALIEVKATTSLSETKHIPDIAVQAYILRAAGIPIVRCELMHLNRECRHPDLTNLFVREDVTDSIEARLVTLSAEISAQLDVARLDAAPAVEPGAHCSDPEECPFMSRCWQALPEHHVSTLYRVTKKKTAEYVESGWHTIHDLPDSVKLSATAARQRRSVRSGEVLVEREALVAALATLVLPVAHLDFETVQPAIPVWPGCRPYQNVPVQLSCHVVDGDSVRHHAWIFDADGDPRPQAARAILEACASARTITAYFASFEQQCIRLIAEACPECAAELNAIADGIVDLLPMVRDNVYHPRFGGSFSLKKVLPALLPALGYSDLEIGEGQTASVELARMIFSGSAMSGEEREQMRQALLAYCERDTYAMVALSQQLEILATDGGGLMS